MKLLRAALFDFDGTLADSYPAITASVNHVRHRHDLPALPVDVVRRFVGGGPEYLMENTIPGADPEECLQAYRQHHPSVMYDHTELLPGAAELLSALRNSGIHMGLCSNKPRYYSSKLLAHLGLADTFDIVLGPEDVTNPKPAPEMLQLALERLQTPPEQALYIGDMSVDIETARGANVTVWVVATGSETQGELQAAQPDRILEDLWEAAVWLHDVI